MLIDRRVTIHGVYYVDEFLGLDNSPCGPGELYERLMATVPWLSVTEARHEAFMSPKPRWYTYGSGAGERTYGSILLDELVESTMAMLNVMTDSSYNVCFLNRYDNEKQHLGWHADDSPTMCHDHPIAVISLGEEREIWWRHKGDRGVVPAHQRQRLGDGSLFVMPPYFQLSNEHRIPKGDRQGMSPRISLTFRRFRD